MKKLQATKRVATGVLVLPGDKASPSATPPLKKIKLGANAVPPSNGPSVSTSLLESHSPKKSKISESQSSCDFGISTVVPVVDVSSNKPPSNLSGAEFTVKTQPTQVTKEPPVLPTELPSVVQDKVTELLQVSLTCSPDIMVDVTEGCLEREKRRCVCAFAVMLGTILPSTLSVFLS